MEIITVSTIIVLTGLITGGSMYIKNKIWEFSEELSLKITGRKYMYTDKSCSTKLNN